MNTNRITVEACIFDLILWLSWSEVQQQQQLRTIHFMKHVVSSITVLAVESYHPWCLFDFLLRRPRFHIESEFVHRLKNNRDRE